MKIFDWHKGKKRTHCTAVIVAAGSSSRMQGIDKIMTSLDGEPVIIRTIRAFQQSECIDEIVLVVRAEMIEKLQYLCGAYDFTKVQAVVAGGDSRRESVMAGLKAASPRTVLVAVQDGARPLVTDAIIRAVVDRAMSYHAAAPAVPVTDTIKVIDEAGRVAQTPERSSLRAVQTPQVFDRDLLIAAWERARKEHMEYTDDSSAMEGLGIHVYLTEGSQENIKITTPLDLQIAEMILDRRKQQ